MSLYLEIRLHSPLASSDGGGSGGCVDAEVVSDKSGLPYIPGRRIKGLWRDAYRELEDALRLCDIDGSTPFPSSAALFGESGLKSSLCRIGDAYLENYRPDAIRRKWIDYCVEQGMLTKDEVMSCFSTTRTQTSIDRRTGTAMENTLRATRLLYPGLVFSAPVTFEDSTYEKQFAISAGLIRHMGLSRTRGWGEVSCRLVKKTDDSKPDDLTQMYRQRRFEEINAIFPQNVPSIESNQKPKSSAMGYAEDDSFSHMIRYRLTLTAQAVIPSFETDPFTTGTLDYIPGRAVLGVFAWRYLQKERHADASFRNLFLGRSLRFFDALPACAKDDTKRRLPVPHSLRVVKGSEQQIVDLAADSEDDTDARPMKRLAFSFLDLENRELAKSEKTLNFHHSRSKDRRFGRAAGKSGHVNAGSIFTYEALEAGQCFIGAIMGDERNLRTAISLLSNGTHCRIGRSKSAQYGGFAEIEWLDGTPRPCSEFSREAEGLAASKTDVQGEDEEISEFRITCLSPLMAVNEYGHPAALLPLEELAEVLHVEMSDLSIKKSFVRTMTFGGFLSHIRMPAAQTPALAAGSVFVIESKKEIHISKLLLLEKEGLGLHKHEGFGRIGIEIRPLVGKYEDTCKRKTDRKPNPESFKTSGALDFISEVLANRAENTLTGWAIEIAKNAQNPPAGSQLSRLIFIIHKAEVDKISEFKEYAEKKLQDCKLEKPDSFYKDAEVWKEKNKLSLYNTVLSYGKNQEAELKEIAAFILEHRSTKIDRIIKDSTEDKETIAVKMVERMLSRKSISRFLSQICHELSKTFRKTDEPELAEERQVGQ